jgi:hypothetical protein
MVFPSVSTQDMEAGLVRLWATWIFNSHFCKPTKWQADTCFCDEGEVAPSVEVTCRGVKEASLALKKWYSSSHWLDSARYSECTKHRSVPQTSIKSWVPTGTDRQDMARRTNTLTLARSLGASGFCNVSAMFAIFWVFSCKVLSNPFGALAPSECFWICHQRGAFMSTSVSLPFCPLQKYLSGQESNGCHL